MQTSKPTHYAVAALAMTPSEFTNDKFIYYPRYCFPLSKTYTTWARLSASDIHLRLHQPPSLPCPPDTWFILNHPIRFIRVVGTVVAADVYEKRTVLVIDDFSGYTLELIAQNDECNLSRFQVDDVIKARGTVSERWQRKELVVKKAEIVEDELEAWKEMADWKREHLLPGPWRLDDEEIAKRRSAYKKKERKKRKEKEAEIMRKRKAELENTGQVEIIKDEKKRKKVEEGAAVSIVDDEKKRKRKRPNHVEIKTEDLEVQIVDDERIRPPKVSENPLSMSLRRSRTTTPLPPAGGSITIIDDQPRCPPTNHNRISQSRPIPPPSTTSSTMSWEVEIVDDVPKASSRYQQPPRNEQPSQRISREPADGWDVEILDDKRTVPSRDPASAQPLPSRQPRPPKLPSVKSQVLSHLRDADQPNITVRELTDAGIPVDFRVIEELVGEGWLMYMGGQRRGIDTVWRYVGEWLIRPEVQSTIRRSQTVDARKIWGRVKNKEGFEQVGKEVVKEVLFRIMEGHAEWRGDGRGGWRRVEERG